MKKRFVYLLILCLILTMIPFMSLAAATEAQGNQTVQTAFPDVEGHWAKNAITKWSDLGIVKGDSRGFRPDDPITRAEMAVILDNLMGYHKEAVNSFSDVSGGAWYAAPVLKANAAGILAGDGAGHAAPTENITREQAAVMISRAFGADADSSRPTSFKDSESISSWARHAVFAMEANGYIGGMGDGYFKPGANITRAQVVTMIDNAVKAYYVNPGTYTADAAPAGNNTNCIAVIKSGGVVLKGAKISGDLIIAEGVGDGSVTLDGVTVTGSLIVRGGGENSIHVINGAEVRGTVTIERIDGAVRIVSGGVVIANLDADTEVILEGSFVNVTVAEGASVEIKGMAKSVTLEAKAALMVAKEASVDTITVAKEAGGASVAVSGTVNTISTDAAKTDINISGTAKVTTIHTGTTADGTRLSIDKKAEVKTLDANSEVTSSGSGSPKATTGAGKVTVKESESAGGGGGGGGGGGPETQEPVKSDQSAPTGLSCVAPTSPANNDGKIEGVSTAMEYKAKSASVYQSVSGSVITGLAAGEYCIRYKADSNHNAGTDAIVEVPEFTPIYQFAVVRFFSTGNGMERAKVSLFTPKGDLITYWISDQVDVRSIHKGQIVEYSLDKNNMIAALNTTGEIYSESGLTIPNDQELIIDGDTYDIWEQVIVFAYNGESPGSSSYGVFDLDNVKNTPITSPASVYTDIGGVIAILVPQSALKVLQPFGLEGVAPSSADNSDGKITGVSSEMEYKLSGGSGYNTITNEMLANGDTITGMSPGTYLVRYAASDGKPAGPEATVAVPRYVAKDRYGIVKAISGPNYFIECKVKMLRKENVTIEYLLADGLEVDVKAGQVVTYGLNDNGQIGAMASVDAAYKDTPGALTLSADKKELTINGNIYSIANDAAVFVFDSSITNDSAYWADTLTNVDFSKGTSNSVVNVYINDEDKVEAILVPKACLSHH